jgi:hypothetical protein
MKRILAAVILIAVVSLSALAGEIPSGDFVSPPPPPPNHSTSNSASQAYEADSKQIALDSLESLLFALLGPMFR